LTVMNIPPAFIARTPESCVEGQRTLVRNARQGSLANPRNCGWANGAMRGAARAARHITAMSSALALLRSRGWFAVSEEKFDVAAQMIEAGEGSVETVLGFRKNESALTDALHMKRQAPGRPIGLAKVQTHRGGNVRFKHLDMSEDR